MTRFIATCAALLGILVAVPASSDPSICMASLTDVEILHRVRQDPYFTRNEPLGKNVRIEYEYNGCGYRIHVGERSPASRDGDVLLVDREGRVIRVVHQR